MSYYRPRGDPYGRANHPLINPSIGGRPWNQPPSANAQHQPPPHSSQGWAPAHLHSPPQTYGFESYMLVQQQQPQSYDSLPLSGLQALQSQENSMQRSLQQLLYGYQAQYAQPTYSQSGNYSGQRRSTHPPGALRVLKPNGRKKWQRTSLVSSAVSGPALMRLESDASLRCVRAAFGALSSPKPTGDLRRAPPPSRHDLLKQPLSRIMALSQACHCTCLWPRQSDRRVRSTLSRKRLPSAKWRGGELPGAGAKHHVFRPTRIGLQHLRVFTGHSASLLTLI